MSTFNYRSRDVRFLAVECPACGAEHFAPEHKLYIFCDCKEHIELVNLDQVQAADHERRWWQRMFPRPAAAS